MKNNRHTATDILLLILVTVITYLPVSAFLFSLKNDSLVQYLPYRYHLSESIQHGYFPFWSPYLYTGFPVHADMQGMTWNPIVLIISLFTRYNMSVLELEVTIYLIAAAIGMYSLLKSFSCSRVICVLGGISYMSCGFINGSASVIPWISSAAFIPFVFKYLKHFLEEPRLKSSISFALSLSMLFLCCYPTFFIYTCYIILAIPLFAAIVHFKDNTLRNNIKTFGFLLLSALLFLTICSPAIASYWEFLPYYSRGSGVTLAKAGENPFTPFSSLSFILPNTVNKNHDWLNTDASMRNGYVGLFVFLLFCLSFRNKYSKWQNLILGITIFSFLLSLGEYTPFHKLCYKIFPLINTFRHPGNIRLFTSIGIILLAAFYAQSLTKLNIQDVKKKVLPAIYGIAIILGIGFIYCLFQSGIWENIASAFKSIKQPKAFLDAFSFNSFFLIQSLLQLSFAAILIYLLQKKVFNKKVIAAVIAFNCILFCWIALPFTFISQVKTKTINQYVASFPNGYPLPDLITPVEANSYNNSATVSPYGFENFYKKTIILQDHLITPTMNEAYNDFCSKKTLRKIMDKYPFAYLCNSILSQSPDSSAENTFTNKKIAISDNADLQKNIADQPGSYSLTIRVLHPILFSFTTKTDAKSFLCIFQQYNHNWKVKVNGVDAEVLKMNIAFMGVQVLQGNSTVEFVYRPVRVITCMYLSAAAIALVFLFFILTAIKSSRKL